MRKNYFLLSSLTVLAMPAQLMTTFTKTAEDNYKPDWLRETAVIKDQKNYSASKTENKPWKWNKDISFEDLNAPLSFKSFEVVSAKISFKVKFKVFKWFYDGGTLVFNNDQRLQAEEKLKNRQSLNLWLESNNKFWVGGLEVKYGVENLESVYNIETFSSWAHKYEIYDFEIKIEYQWLTNTKQEEMAEQNIRNFFNTEQQFPRVFNYTNGRDILNMLRVELRKLLPKNLKKDLEIDLYNKDYEDMGKQHWFIKVWLFNGTVFGNDGSEYFTLKLKNIKQVSPEVIEIYKTLKENDWEVEPSDKFRYFENESRRENLNVIFADALKNYVPKYLKNNLNNIVEKTFNLEPLKHSKSFAITFWVYIKQYQQPLFDRPIAIVNFEEF